MSTRRDELSAHTFARKRTLAAFLQPDSRVSDEEAPRPVRAMMPSIVVGVVLVAGSIAWGAIAPSAPPGWDKPGEHIIVDSDSTTRYVVLPHKTKSGKKTKQLHPVLNFASAKLVLDKGKGEVIEVSGKDIDASPIPRGATIGIPYAPDRLPDDADAESAKEWAVCEKPGPSGEGEPQQGVFVLGGRDKDTLKNKYRLDRGEGLYVEDAKTGDRYVIDGTGTKLLLDGPQGKTQAKLAERNVLTKQVLRDPGEPQKVSGQWLKTLNSGADLVFPKLDAPQGTDPAFPGVDSLPAEARSVGKVLKSSSGGVTYYYMVLKERVQRVTPLVARLYLVQQGEKLVSVSNVEVAGAGASDQMDTGGKGWPENVLKHVNRPPEGFGSTSRQVSCSVYTGKMANGAPKLAAWAGPDYPANVVDGSANAYVSPGSGLLYREFSGRGGGGAQFLLTDSGLRYALPKGGGDEQQAAGASEKSPTARLGYEKAKIASVPQTWSSLLPKGPTLDTRSASQEQGL
ncbi:type VII secretion protein EccB [Streptomyces sp. WMMB 322]|uniref:type VII secretion protein EccB n=1 Tax=Streptomyces sp. WMMB 322 TaxID=1286821 RepID=UPI0006E2882F|nr:type VII secretion protein EccB [Streptomyces sp. WMMB 322]SCK33137.1 type VII secretion protein EccB [Streptomyces sp. WMMB 322]